MEFRLWLRWWLKRKSLSKKSQKLLECLNPALGRIWYHKFLLLKILAQFFHIFLCFICRDIKVFIQFEVSEVIWIPYWLFRLIQLSCTPEESYFCLSLTSIKLLGKNVDWFLNWMLFIQKWCLFSLWAHLRCKITSYSAPNQSNRNNNVSCGVNTFVPLVAKDFFNFWLLLLIRSIFRGDFVTLSISLLYIATWLVLNIFFIENYSCRENKNYQKEIYWNQSTSKYTKGFDGHHLAENIGIESCSSGRGSNTHCSYTPSESIG